MTILLILSLIISPISYKNKTDFKEEFILEMEMSAKESAFRNNIGEYTLLAIAAHESSYGRSYLCRSNCNYGNFYLSSGFMDFENSREFFLYLGDRLANSRYYKHCCGNIECIGIYYAEDLEWYIKVNNIIKEIADYTN